MRLKWFLKCLLVGALGAAPATANAEIIDFRGSGLNAAVSISVRNATGSWVSHSVAAGELNWRWLYGTPDGFKQDFFSYCVDALNYLRDPQTVSIDTTANLTLGGGNRPAATNAGARVAWLFNTFAESVHTSGSGIAAAALQVAIWEALYDGSSGDLAGGNFRLNTTGTVRTQAGTFLSALQGSNYSTANATWLNTNYGQDQITHGVPETVSMLMLGMGLLAYRRRL